MQIFSREVFERFSRSAHSVLTLAQQEEDLINHSFIGTEHILLGLVREYEGVGIRRKVSRDLVR